MSHSYFPCHIFVTFHPFNLFLTRILSYIVALMDSTPPNCHIAGLGMGNKKPRSLSSVSRSKKSPLFIENKKSNGDYLHIDNFDSKVSDLFISSESNSIPTKSAPQDFCRNINP